MKKIIISVLGLSLSICSMQSGDSLVSFLQRIKNGSSDMMKDGLPLVSGTKPDTEKLIADFEEHHRALQAIEKVCEENDELKKLREIFEDETLHLLKLGANLADVTLIERVAPQVSDLLNTKLFTGCGKARWETTLLGYVEGLRNKTKDARRLTDVGRIH